MMMSGFFGIQWMWLKGLTFLKIFGMLQDRADAEHLHRLACSCDYRVCIRQADSYAFREHPELDIYRLRQGQGQLQSCLGRGHFRHRSDDEGIRRDSS
jgi:hypothetical protein